ncbi:zinc finger domain-containing protein [Paenibacillus timonensis]|uniref:zinc finger domain-containing protein n=1 Tax=Paenibacillus timonensis TaxID=225915 RepID=UPI001F062909|nr:zinc finger domain-containing protein [Paenibacillus timonensis]
MKKLFESRCPNCSQPLVSERDADRSLKTCPQCRYKEETYLSLGVTVVYNETRNEFK